MNVDWKQKLTSRKLWMAVAGFITTYAAYPIIDKYMIAPWKKDEPEELIEEEE